MFDDTTPEADDGGLVTATVDPDGAESLSVTITEAVARAKGVASDELDARLFDAIDPDALERLFDPTDRSTHEAEVRFHIDGNSVVVQNTGDIFVRPLEEATDDQPE
jgi:hypothetical protein